MKQLISLEGLSPDQIRDLEIALANRKTELLRQELTEVAHNLERVMFNVEESKLKSDMALELERKRHRMVENRFGHITATQLGQQFNVSIGPKVMGTLLKLCGIAKVGKGRTEPYREYLQNGTAKIEPRNGHDAYMWNPQKCIEKIEQWLSKNGYIDEFYRQENERSLERFINSLRDRHLKC